MQSARVPAIKKAPLPRAERHKTSSAGEWLIPVGIGTFTFWWGCREITGLIPSLALNKAVLIIVY